MIGRPKNTGKYKEPTRTVRIPKSIDLKRLTAWIWRELKRKDKS